ncbi:malonate decarboxylase holo-[acyl-carrier-protein] synthase [Allorhizobium taibaishanense]|uniref:Malonate decarboxylase holo-[acyl-carrier-protein] synthase n=1 Tax=Allorhizobium taibaishanense TaxID=887144 RepID=A0A1Q9A6W8_9HYPH|nr:malonate decarboxylase holo-[acyl-carrier-protein] synthase [Allorhizobium taibaishanense]MBB4008522.1 phosphoribosyl-dephospho-CoA transferase [Allorhizobium taibaishanense]OLP50321.1 malonate decarboxylase holo-[acyl-carrier-protein] synthase [Allorhizobium taibaishanense]
MRPERHRFVTLKPCWRDNLRPIPACSAEEHTWERLCEWIDTGGCLVVASAQPDDPPSSLRLGYATPDKQRIGLWVDETAVAALFPEVTLDQAGIVAPASWSATIDAVLAVADRFDIAASVFGSLAWQMQTGETYLHPQSDLDLVLRPAKAVNSDLKWIDALAAVLASHDQPRIDGEVLLPDGCAVPMRELMFGADELLEKRHGGVRLVPRATVLDRLGA